jgi:prophage regulatory protein
MSASLPDDLRPLWSLLGSNEEVTAFEAGSRPVLERAAAVKIGTMLSASMCLWQAATGLSTNNTSAAVAWAAAAFLLVTGARLWWRLTPSASATGQCASLLDALARGEMTALRAKRQGWRPDELDRLDPSVFRHPFARLNFGRSAFAKWCAEWSWYAPAAPDLLVAGLAAGKDGPIGQEPSRIGEGEAPPSAPAAVALAAAGGPNDRPKVEGRTGRRDRRSTESALPLFDTRPVLQASQPSIDTQVQTPASASEPQEMGRVSSPRGGRAQLLTIAEVLDMLSMSRSTFYRLIRNSEFPAPLRIGSGVRYSAPEVEAWIEAQRRLRSGE